MGPRPWKPAAELDGALGRGDLRFAMTLAEEIRIERGKAIDLSTAARFLPLIARESPKEFDSWALRWLARWIAETGSATIERAAEVAGCLADLPGEPAAIDGLFSDASPRHQ
jgi:hypothetical protein